MKIFTFNASSPAEVGNDQLEVPSGPRFGWTEEQPTSGYWKVGDLLLGVGPAAGQTFLCTAEGSPGTWVASGGGGGGGGLKVLGSATVNLDGMLESAAGCIIASELQQPAGSYHITFDRTFPSNRDYVLTITPDTSGMQADPANNPLDPYPVQLKQLWNRSADGCDVQFLDAVSITNKYYTRFYITVVESIGIQ
jgi:hypothetical protein